MKSKTPTPELYLAFPKAFSELRDRIGATENEIACWLFFDEIKAYGHVHTFQPPPEVSLEGVALTNWTQADKGDRPHLNALEGAFFLISDIEKFNPPTRYISLEDLVRRWAPHRRSQEATISFILSRINQSRLIDFSPGLGQTELSSNLQPAPPAEWAMFDLSHIEAIELTDFPAKATTAPPKPQTNLDFWKTEARQIGEEWKNEQIALAKTGASLPWKNAKSGNCPSVEAIAKYVEGELCNRGIKGARGKFLDYETIKREALTGITRGHRAGRR